MISASNRPKTPNFIKRNILNCTGASRTSAKISSTALNISGIPIILLKKQKSLEASKNIIQGNITIEKCAPRVDVLANVRKENIQKLPAKIKTHSGVRRTSIRRRVFSESPQVLNSLLEESSTKKKVDYKNWSSKNRQCLELHVTTIPEPVTHFNPNSIKKANREVWEALERVSRKRLERLLAVMENRLEITQKKGDSCCVHTNVHTNENKSDLRHTEDLISNKTKSGEEDHLHNIYQKVYGNHFNVLSTIIAQEQVQTSITDTPPISRPKKKDNPKLEIKIAANSSASDQNVKSIGKGLEELNIFEELDDHCGDLTPVITFNHVCSDSGSRKFQFSSIRDIDDSRSPSPLLEVPNSTEGVTARMPPF